MSKVTIAGDVNGTGVFTIAAPNGNTNRTLTLPDEAGTIATTAFVTNRLIQNLNVTTGAVATGTAKFVLNDLVPQITQGVQYMQLAITPTSVTSRLEITATGNLSADVANFQILALFRDAVGDALGVVSLYNSQGGSTNILVLSHSMIAGTTSEIIFRVRMGGVNAGTDTFNGRTAGRLHGGKLASSITIKEYAA